MRDAASELTDGLHLLRLAKLAFEQDPLAHVAADEEILVIGLRPDAGPGQRHRVAVLVHIAAFEVARVPAAPGVPHSSRVFSRSAA